MTKKECFEYFDFDDSYWTDDPSGEMTKTDWQDVKSCCLDDIFDIYFKDFEYCGFSISNKESCEDYINYIEKNGLMPYEDFLNQVYIPQFKEECVGEKEYRHMIMHESYKW